MRRLTGVGLGWRRQLAHYIDTHEGLGFVEVLAEHLDPGGPLPEPLVRLRERGVPVVLHAVSLATSYVLHWTHRFDVRLSHRRVDDSVMSALPRRFEPRWAVGTSGRLARAPALLPLRWLVVFLPVLPGCSINHYQPGHFQFTTIVEKTRPGPDGWRAACVHATVINQSTLEPYFCEFGVGMPIENRDVGLMSEPLAQRIAADCANKALSDVIAAPASVLPGLVCTQFRNTFHEVLNRAVLGSKVTALCEKKTKPFRVDF